MGSSHLVRVCKPARVALLQVLENEEQLRVRVALECK